ncbi:unnamed protein product [Danaus chrysippus]|uniref:(African queen) hypothetical protein n=1 Tax=Danaus chrysippus TaxID=151541 RepID=A0A8J2R517_9NEOP|nr:unnamed protein product [Danaus chrysippus]
MESKHICMLPAPACMDLPPTAGWLRWQLCKIGSLMLPCEWHYGSAFTYGVGRPWPWRETGRGARAPGSSGIPTALSSATGTLYICSSIYSHSFTCRSKYSSFVSPNPYDAFILLCDLVSFLDIFTRFITGYHDEDNKLIVLDKKIIAKEYVRGTFVFDLIGALPLQVYQPHQNCQFPTHTVMFVFKLARLPSLRIKWLEMFQQLSLSYVTTVAIAVVVRALLFFHWMTYIHYQVPAFFSHYYNRDTVWAKRFHMQIPNEAIFQVYTTNLYWVCGICVGAGYFSPVDDYIIPDLLLTTTIGIIGLLFLIYSFTTLLRLFIYGQHDKYLYNGRLKDLEEYMKLKRIPKSLFRKILLFLNYKFHGTYFNEEAILNTINEQIKQDINMHFCKKLVTNIPIFQDMPVAFVNTIIFNLTHALYMPGEIVVSCGETVNCLYMISSGTVSILNSVGKELTHLRDGAYFGEDALYDPDKIRTTTVLTLEITEMYKLSNESYRSCIRPYPHLDDRLRASSVYTSRPNIRTRKYD